MNSNWPWPGANMETIEDVINLLANAPRIGADKDEPEGARYIQISDTLALQMASVLGETCKKINEIHEIINATKALLIK